MMDSKHPFKILTENMPAENALVTEYAEEFTADKNQSQGYQMFTYEKVVLAHGHLYRAWALLANQADRKSLTLIKTCVESLEAIPILAPAPAPASTATAVPASAPLPVSAPASAK